MMYLRLTIAAVLAIVTTAMLSAQSLSSKELVGKKIFFDTNLSEPAGQSCAACHGPEVGFTGPNATVNTTTVVYPGAVNTRFGNRKPPSAAYGGESPVMSYEQKGELFVGGMFWDGRATGWDLGDPLAEQARGPFLNPLEQDNPSKAAVVDKIHQSDYAALFEEVYGTDVWNDVDDAYNKAARSIAAYERSFEVSPFTSKYDYYLKHEVKLTKQEHEGMVLFNSRAKCSGCHISKRGPKGEPPLFTDFTYDNLGVPKNPDNPFYTMPPEFNPSGEDYIDEGLGGFLESTPYNELASENFGKQKVPTLRNVDKRPNSGFTKAFAHNGYFKSLKDIVHFYNTRDVEVWPPPEVADNVNHDELGDLRLSSEQEDAIVAFLGTLSDGYVVQGPRTVPSPAAEGPLQIGRLQNVPNPFNPVTVVHYTLAEASHVTLKVYDVLGREVAVLVDADQPAGEQHVQFSAGDLPSGLYLCRLATATHSELKKMLLLR